MGRRNHDDGRHDRAEGIRGTRQEDQTGAEEEGEWQGRLHLQTYFPGECRRRDRQQEEGGDTGSESAFFAKEKKKHLIVL